MPAVRHTHLYGVDGDGAQGDDRQPMLVPAVGRRGLVPGRSAERRGQDEDPPGGQQRAPVPCRQWLADRQGLAGDLHVRVQQGARVHHLQRHTAVLIHLDPYLASWVRLGT